MLLLGCVRILSKWILLLREEKLKVGFRNERPSLRIPPAFPSGASSRTCLKEASVPWQNETISRMLEATLGRKQVIARVLGFIWQLPSVFSTWDKITT